MPMEKTKKPTADEIFELFLLALEDEEVKLAGDIGGFKDALYEGFKDFIYRKRYKEEMVFDYIDLALESLLGTSEPMQQTDYIGGQQAAGI